jgi:hypothetical protein
MTTVGEFRNKIIMYDDDVDAAIIGDDNGEVPSDKLMSTMYRVYIIKKGDVFELLDDDPFWDTVNID